MIRARHVGAILAALTTEGVERANGAAPTAFRIWKAGANVTDHGVHVFSASSAEKLLAQQEARGNLFSIDVDHLSLNENAPPESHKAVGWHRLEVRNTDEGPELWAVDVQWTDAVKAGLEKDPPEWRYFSPAYDVDRKSGEIVGYLNTALTNSPATWSVTTLATQTTTRSSGMNKEEMRAALMAWAGDDEDKKSQAEAQLAAMFPEGEEPKKETKASEEPGGEEPKKETKASEEPGGEEPKKETKASAPAPSSLDAALLLRVETLEREAATRTSNDEKREREAIFASRPDISEKTKGLLAKEKPERVRELLASIPVAAAKTQRPNVAPVLAPVTRGAGQTGGEIVTMQATRMSDQADALDQAMGFAKREAPIRLERNSLVCAVMTPSQARAHVKKHGQRLGLTEEN